MVERRICLVAQVQRILPHFHSEKWNSINLLFTMTGFFWLPLKLGERWVILLQTHHDVECYQELKSQLEFLHTYKDESARGHRAVWTWWSTLPRRSYSNYRCPLPFKTKVHWQNHTITIYCGLKENVLYSQGIWTLCSQLVALFGLV